MPGWKQRRVWGPILWVLVLPCLLFPGALPGSRVVSADDHLSVHHAFQDDAGGAVRHPTLSDPAVQFKALNKRVVSDLKVGKAPLWNPDLYAGTPLLADGQSRVFSPVTWFHLALSNASAQDLGVYWLLTWMGLGTLWLLVLLGAGPWGAVVGATAAVTGPFLHVWLLHPHASTFVWLPWVLVGVERVRRGGVGWLLALAVAGLLAGGHLETAAHGLLLALGWSLWRVRRVALVGGFGIGVLLAAPAWLPLVEQVLGSATLEAHGGNRLQFGQWADLLWPGWHGHPAAVGYRGPGVWADGVLHPGLGALGLAVWGWRKPMVRGLLLGWGICLVLATTGAPGPLNHARLGGVGALGVALAAGVAVHGFAPRGRALALLAVLGTGAWARHLDQGSLPAEQHDLAAAPWVKQLAQVVGEGRVVGMGWALQPNTGSLAGLKDVRGYDLPVSSETEAFMAHLDPGLKRPWFPITRLTQANQRLLAFAGVRVVVSTKALPDKALLEVGPAPLHVYALDLEAPRAWMATGARAVTSAEAGFVGVEEERDARGAPPVEGLNGEWPLAGTWVAATATDLPGGEVHVQRVQETPGILVLADAWAPGWTAEAGSRVAPVLRAGGAFRAVELLAGEREVVFRYRPAGWVGGTRLGGLGLLGFLGLTGWGRRRSR